MIKRFFKKIFKSIIDSRQKAVNLKLARLLLHEYPSHYSVYDIAKEREKARSAENV